MAAKRKSTDDTVRLTHSNGATVTVSAEKAERLRSAGSFTVEKASTTSTTSSK